MGPDLILPVYGLALLDTLSPATVGVTIYVLLTADRGAVRLLAAYATTVAVFYFALGAGLVAGLGTVVDAVGDAVDGRTAAWGQLVAGAALFAASFLVPTAPATDGAARARRSARESRAHTIPAMVVLGLTTGVVEAASAVPYLAAIGLMTAADLTPVQWAPLLAGYTLIMVVPVLVLFLGWRVLGERIRHRLERARTWLADRSRSAFAWMLGIAGFVIGTDALAALEIGLGGAAFG